MQIGNKTECGMLGFVQAIGKDYQQTRDQHPEETFVHVSLSSLAPYSIIFWTSFQNIDIIFHFNLSPRET